ncbi:MAG: ABC transporter permease [Desulfuromonadales bacterium]|nr:MAG: ABC transporter permease [Desulfuromonadales bacterium]
MKSLMLLTLRGVVRDRVLHGILATSLLFVIIPTISSFSMRQVTELSITLSLSLISFLLLVLAVFLGGTSIWKDIERRYTFSVLGLPIRRGDYLFGKFFGIAAFMVICAFILLLAAGGVIWYSSGIYPSDRPVVWEYIVLAVAMDCMKYILLVAISFALSSLSTSFFLPVFGTISLYFVGGATQEAYDFIHTATGQSLPALTRKIASALYYVLPNLSAFDFKVNAIYGVPVKGYPLLLTIGYGVVYVMILMAVSSLIFSRREMK